MGKTPKTSLLQWRHRRRAVATTTTAAGDGSKIVDVWAHNMESELETIRGVIPDYPILSVTASPDVAAGRVPGGPDDDDSFQTFSPYVCGLHFAEVSLAFTNSRGERRGVWRFHLGDFDAGHLRFFVEAGVEAPAVRRACATRLAGALMDLGTLCNPRVAWVTCDGAADMAFLMMCYIMHMPRERYKALPQLRSFFPAMYDLKVLAMHGELTTADSGIVNEILLQEEEAPAALNATVMAAFAECLGDPTAAARMETYHGLLFGFDEEDMPTMAALPQFSMDPARIERCYWMLSMLDEDELRATIGTCGPLPSTPYGQLPPMHPAEQLNCWMLNCTT